MTPELHFPDHDSLLDLGRYAARARALDAAASLRLRAEGTTLAVYAGVLDGRGVLGDGTVLGLRVMGLAEPATIDQCVPAAAISDRVAHPGEQPILPVPPMQDRPVWAALSPPRAGWEPAGELDPESVVAAARGGIAAVAEGTPDGAGALAVADLRQRVWGTAAGADPEFPRGLALAAYGLGFLVADELVRLYRSGRWTRLSTSAGHALTR